MLTTPFSNTSMTQAKAQAPASPPSPAPTLQVWNLNAFNPDASAVAYLQLFDLASASVTVGTTAPTKVIALPPQGGVDTARVAPMCFYSGRVTFAVTATPTGAGAPATPCVLSMDYGY